MNITYYMLYTVQRNLSICHCWDAGVTVTYLVNPLHFSDILRTLRSSVSIQRFAPSSNDNCCLSPCMNSQMILFVVPLNLNFLRK